MTNEILTHHVAAKLRFGLVCVFGGAFVLGSVLMAGPVANAGTGVMPSAGRPTVAPLPTLTPTRPAAAARVASDGGGHIQLTIPMTETRPAPLRAVVQWQGPQGEWYDVDGWQSVATGSTIDWWVAPADFGKGPFRWVVFQTDSQHPVQATERFWLPTIGGAWLRLTSRPYP